MQWNGSRKRLSQSIVFKQFAEGNFLMPNNPAPLTVAWIKKLGIYEMPGGIKVEWDYLHAVIYVNKVCIILNLIVLYCSSHLAANTVL